MAVAGHPAKTNRLPHLRHLNLRVIHLFILFIDVKVLD
jgi:hypothetical protein